MASGPRRPSACIGTRLRPRSRTAPSVPATSRSNGSRTASSTRPTTASDLNGFWTEAAKRLHWYKAPTKIKNSSFGPGNVSIKWFEDGVLNAAYNCIDRHLPKRANQTAIIWEGDDPSQSKHITYRELHDEVCKFANILRNRNVE